MPQLPRVVQCCVGGGYAVLPTLWVQPPLVVQEPSVQYRVGAWWADRGSLPCVSNERENWKALGVRSLTYIHPSLAGNPARWTGVAYDPDDESYIASNELPAFTEVCIIRTLGPGGILLARGVVVDTGSVLLDNGLDVSEALFQHFAPLAVGRVNVLVVALGEISNGP